MTDKTFMELINNNYSICMFLTENYCNECSEEDFKRISVIAMTEVEKNVIERYGFVIPINRVDSKHTVCYSCGSTPFIIRVRTEEEINGLIGNSIELKINKDSK